MLPGLNILKENTDYFGIDIGTSAVKIVQLKKSFGKYELISFGSAPVPEGLAQSDSTVDIKKLGRIIKELVHSMHLITKNVIVSLPGSAIFTTVVKIPKMPMSEVKKAISYQAEQNVPLKISEIKIDWQVIGQSPDTGEISVMIIAAPIQKTQKMANVVEEAGLDLDAIEINAIAVARALHTNEPLYMIVDIGTFMTELSVVQNGVLTLTRTIPVGGQVITRAIAQNLGMETTQAEQFKTKFGIDKDKMEGKIFKAARSILNNLTEEIERSTKYYQDQYSQNVTLLKMTGGCSKLLGIQDFLSDNLGINVVYGNPWASVVHKPDITNQLNQNAADYAVAVGLAMRGL